MPKELLFSLSKSDFEVQTFRSGGKGGQHQNTTDSGVRIIHKASGVAVECREERNQHENKKRAFRRLAEHKKFKAWVALECARVTGRLADIEQEVERITQDRYIKAEVKDANGRWIPWSKDSVVEDPTSNEVASKLEEATLVSPKLELPKP